MDPRDHNTGLQIDDLLLSPDFMGRPEHPRVKGDVALLQRLSRVLKETPEGVLQELVEAACDLCGADSAGISMETENTDGIPVFHWVALSGTYGPFRDAMLPQSFMPCLICIRTWRAQLFRVPPLHFKFLMNIVADPVTDGMLLPWTSDGQRATIWIVAHERTHAFDHVDYEVMKVFADFAAVAYKHLQQTRRAIAAASASGAQSLAQHINDPLQSITNSLFLAGEDIPEAADHAREATEAVNRLAEMVQNLVMAYREHRLQ